MKISTIIFIILTNHVKFLFSIQYKSTIIVYNNDCFNESCYDSIDDIANSPLVECSYL
jgi:hypothetical protein